MRQYDPQNNRLVYLTGTAQPEDWDQRWSKSEFELLFSKGRNAWLLNETKRFLPLGSRILEGGCGCGDKVYTLSKGGFDTIGFDTAKKTLHRALKFCPELNLEVGDIRNFPLADSSVDGYWSLGVFEHFQEGMQAQWEEAARVIRTDGYLFMTMPIMSPLRQLKAKRNAYPKLTKVPSGSFYQYAYSPKEVIETASFHGFELMHTRLFDGVKGLKDEVSFLRGALQRLYDSNTIIAKILRRIIDVLLRSFSGHMGFYVFRRLNQKMTVKN